MTTERTPCRSLSCAETAKLVRQALKLAFPGVKFSVKSSVYTGGASIDVGWTDGPAEKRVEAVTNAYRGGDFDGMIDLQIYRSHWLTKDGQVSLAYNPGTEGSRGVIPREIGLPPAADAELVSFGADFIFCNRRHSAELLERAALEVSREWLVIPAEIVTTPAGYPYVKEDCRRVDDNYGRTVAELTNITAHAMDA